MIRWQCSVLVSFLRLAFKHIIRLIICKFTIVFVLTTSSQTLFILNVESQVSQDPAKIP